MFHKFIIKLYATPHSASWWHEQIITRVQVGEAPHAGGSKRFPSEFRPLTLVFVFVLPSWNSFPIFWDLPQWTNMKDMGFFLRIVLYEIEVFLGGITMSLNESQWFLRQYVSLSLWVWRNSSSGTHIAS